MLADSGVTLGITAESTLAGLPEGRWLTVADLLGAQVSGEAVLADGWSAFRGSMTWPI